MNAYDFLLSLGEIDPEIVEKGIEYMYPERGGKSAGGGHKKIAKMLPIAAVLVALIAALCATAYALNWFGLSTRLTPAEDPNPMTGVVVEDTSNGGWMVNNGAAGSDEALASLAWTAAQWEMSNNMEIDNAQIEAWRSSLEDYAQESMIYSFYSQEMLDKLLEIQEQYGLRLHNERAHPMTQELFYKATGLDNFLLTDNASWSGHYIFEDGSFKGDGTIELNEKHIVYSLNRSMPGALAPYGLYISRPEDYEEWQIELDGHTLNLALSRGERGYDCFIFTQVKDAFITITLNARSSTGEQGILERADVETIAAFFDYEALGGGQPDLSVINGMTKVEVKAKDGLFTVEDYLQTPEYLAGSAFRHTFCDWYDSQQNNQNYMKGQYLKYYYAPFPTDVEELDELLGSLQEQYGLKMPTSAQCIINNKWVAPERMLSPISVYVGDEKDLSKVFPGPASPEDYWTLIGTENFILSQESHITSLAKWDNGVWQAYIFYGSTSYELNYVPKGSFSPVLRESLHPESTGWAYDTACGEQVYICLDGEMVYPRFPNSVVLYETDTAYVIISVSGSKAADMQMYADNIDFTKFK